MPLTKWWPCLASTEAARLALRRRDGPLKKPVASADGVVVSLCMNQEQSRSQAETEM